ncbi:hypothetical protein, partial [Mycobacterium sp.]|uniref:hypothetical protein n=1 Tax=Mycobacterium sp. TaxID=1785 RepID=UPI00334274E9
HGRRMVGASRPARSHPLSTARRPSPVQLFQTTLGAARRDGDEREASMTVVHANPTGPVHR